MKNDRIAVISFGLVMGGAVAFAIFRDISSAACFNVDLEKLNEGRPVFGCVEFWLNRYQSLLGSFVSLAAALLVISLTYRQVREMWKQGQWTHATELDRERQALRRERQHGSDIGEILVEIMQDCRTAKRARGMPVLSSLWATDMAQRRRAIREVSRPARNAREDGLGTVDIDRVRRLFLNELDVVRLIVQQVLAFIEPREAAKPNSRDSFQQSLDELELRCGRAEKCRLEYNLVISGDIDAITEKIRHLRRAASSN